MDENLQCPACGEHFKRFHRAANSYQNLAYHMSWRCPATPRNASATLRPCWCGRTFPQELKDLADHLRSIGGLDELKAHFTLSLMASL